MNAETDSSVERAARVRIGRSGTVRDRDRFTVDASIEDISTTGCLFRGDIEIELAAVLSVGIPGIGVHAAKVMRLNDGGAGCAFLIPLSHEDVAAAMAAQGEGHGGFLQMKKAIRSAAAPDQEHRGTDRRSVGFRVRQALSVVKGKR